MSEVKRYECTVLIDASCGVTVEASSPEEAAELAENAAAEQGAGSLCHQCSGHTECGDSYAVIVYGEDGQEVLDTDYRSGQLKAAQSELAALREELAKWQGIAGRRTAERTEFMNERDDLQQRLTSAESELARKDVVFEDLVESNCDMAQFLAAAEQRNACYESLLRQIIPCLAMSTNTTASTYIRQINEAFPKPTESGASEPQCCDLFPKCVCHEGADGL